MGILSPVSHPAAALYHFAGILLVLALAVLQARLGRAGAFWLILWALPGTILHELSHLIVAALTGGRPTGFRLLPRRDPTSRGRWVLGSVTISRPGPISALPSALAPLLLNLVACYLYLNWGRWFPPDLSHTLLRYGAVYLFCYGSIPSGQDLKIAVSSPTGVALYGAVGAGIWYLLR